LQALVQSSPPPQVMRKSDNIMIRYRIKQI